MEYSQKFKRKRKALLVLPVLVIPFLTMAFWAAEGGKVHNRNVIASKEGLNSKLPDAKLKEQKGLNKLSFYDLAEKDSLKLKSERQNDRYSIRSGEDSNKYSLTQLKRLAENSSWQYHQDGLTGGLQYGSDRTTARSKMAEENLMKKLMSSRCKSISLPVRTATLKTVPGRADQTPTKKESMSAPMLTGWKR